MATGNKWGKQTGNLQPEGKVRLSQMVMGYGPGAMVDLLDHAVVIGGLEFWHYGASQPLKEPRLRDAVAAQIRGLGRDLAQDDAFREPPRENDREATRSVGVDVLEFPQWFVCQNPECRALTRSQYLEPKGGKYFHYCSRSKSTECVPVRFVAACSRGHLDEFPWVWFAHKDTGKCATPQLRLREGATGDFSEVAVECTSCEAKAQLSTAQVDAGNPPCSGQRPWLGRDAAEPCDQRLRLLVRTASNSYFAQIVSALSVPEHGRELENIVQKHWSLLKNATKELLPACKVLNDELRGDLLPHADEMVLRVIEAVRTERPIPREPLRTAEFKQFLAQPVETGDEQPGPEDDFFARQLAPGHGLPSQISSVILAKRLRELRVQVGFTRLEPINANLQGEYDLKVRTAVLSQTEKWLPANEIKGEGVMLVLDEQAVVGWETSKAVEARGRELQKGYEEWARTVKDAQSFPGVRFYLLHSLSHLLMSAISLECGYSASALRERIYCDAAGTETPMAAILISTGTPGSEGTLGGLVAQGRELRTHLQRAYDLGILCSNDPLCGTHSPAEDPGERFLEGAACHGCLFVAECSCERFNRYLDRSLVVPTIGHPSELAFFSKRP